MIAFEKLKQVKKIAVLRANGIGDFIFCLPALAALRHAFPAAEIIYLGLPWLEKFLLNRPGPIDRVQTVPRSCGVNGDENTQDEEIELAPFFNAMQSEGFDIALQMHGGGRFSNPFIKKIGAKYTVGLKTPEAEPLDRWIPYIYFTPEIIRYLEVVSLVEAAPITFKPTLQVTSDDKEEAAFCFSANKYPRIALNPGAGDIRRRWPISKFAEVGRALQIEGAEVFIIGADHDAQLCANLFTALSEKAHNLCGRLSLGGLLGFFSGIDLLIANDSGPLHMAKAIETPTVGLFWCGNLINAGATTVSLHRPHLSWQIECSSCGANIMDAPCNHEESYIADIKSSAVLASARDLLRGIENTRRVCRV